MPKFEYKHLSHHVKFTSQQSKKNATPASIERVQKYVFNFEMYHFVKKKRPICPILPYLLVLVFLKSIFPPSFTGRLSSHHLRTFLVSFKYPKFLSISLYSQNAVTLPIIRRAFHNTSRLTAFKVVLRSVEMSAILLRR